MVKVTTARFRVGSWFGFQVGFGAAVAVLAGVQGVPEVGAGGREVLLDSVAGADDDHVFGRSAAVGCAAGFAFFGLLHAVTWQAGAVRCLVTGRPPGLLSARAGSVAVADASAGWIR